MKIKRHFNLFNLYTQNLSHYADVDHIGNHRTQIGGNLRIFDDILDIHWINGNVIALDRHLDRVVIKENTTGDYIIQVALEGIWIHCNYDLVFIPAGSIALLAQANGIPGG